MKYLIWVLVAFCIVLQVEIVGLMVLDGTNIKVWNAQLEFNQHVIDAIYAR